ncbi:Transmembrane amino acid transporter protein [Penicillium ucsense]|uniref:Transmembrane amino acid transporter protein n=1 Tax=Penicillium ucsense TaxID=2839758 RepID=A0A8J8W593_9EURO|nr:Transmembrane amino acid transporter protein [Penicillium ucsense]KAF7737016.1 Transmembrane amino acid transporter protein [Penicillium ucsense]
MAWSEDTAGMGHHYGSDDRSPELSDELNQKKLKSLDLEGQGRRHSHHHVTTLDDTSSTSESVGRQIELESENQIKYRTCSWQKTAALLFSEYICLAIMSFPWSYSVLGLVPGLIATVVIAAIVLYTSLTVWRFCLRHPEIRDVCDLGQYLFWDSKIAWWATAVMFLLNNTFIQGLHCVVGAEYLNTMSGGAVCTVVFSLVVAIVSFFFSLPRTFSALSRVATFSAFFTFVSVLLATIFAGIEGHPAKYKASTGLEWLVIPAKGTSFIQGMSAFLNISYTFIGQITLPSFIAEMKEPRDFWKSVTAVTIAEVIVFSIVGAVIYVYSGQYTTAPAFGSLSNEVYKKVAFSFMIPTIIFLGVLYASVSARFIFFRLFDGTRHKGNNTVVGWAAWAAILATLWIAAWIIAEVIPFFSDLLSIMSSLFDSFFGFIFWGVAYIRMRAADYGPDFYKTRGIRGWIGFIFNVFLIAVGFFFLGPGTYASVMSVVQSYRDGTVGGVFTCKSNAL